MIRHCSHLLSIVLLWTIFIYSIIKYKIKGDTKQGNKDMKPSQSLDNTSSLILHAAFLPIKKPIRKVNCRSLAFVKFQTYSNSFKKRKSGEHRERKSCLLKSRKGKKYSQTFWTDRTYDIWTESHNLWCWKGPLEVIWSKLSLQQGHPEHTTSHQLLKIFKEDTTSLGNLQCSVTQTAQTCFLMSRGNRLCSSLCLLPFILALRTTEKTLAPSSLHPPFRCLYTLIRSPPSTLFSRLNSHQENANTFRLS